MKTINLLSSWLRPLGRSKIPLKMWPAFALVIASTSFAQVTNVGFLSNERYAGKTVAELEDPNFVATADVSRYLPAFEVPLNEKVNGMTVFAEFVYGWFKPKVTGNYVFFVCSDDRNNLYLSTDDTPENLKLIARETSWSATRNYVSSGGGSDLTAKRSDQFTGSEWPTPNIITLTAGQRYYIRGVHQAPDCCGNNFSVTFKLEGDPDPKNGDPPKVASELIETIAPAVNVNFKEVSVNFQGRMALTIPTDPLAPTDVAGVVAVANWNNVEDSRSMPDVAVVETTSALNDSTGAATPVTLTYQGNGGWNNGGANITTGDAKMMFGFIQQIGAGTSAKFTFNNVPEGQYDLYIYTSANGDNIAHNISDGNNLTTYYVEEIHQFNDGDAFVQALNTNPNGPRDIGSYVRLSNLGTFGSGSIGFSATHVSGGPGVGIAGIQLAKIGPPVANTNPVSILTQPVGATNVAGGLVSFSVVKRGPGGFQWQKQSPGAGSFVDIPGATNDTFTTAPLTAADHGAKYRVVVTAANNVNSATSVDAVLTVRSPPTQKIAGGVLSNERYVGKTIANLEDPTFAATPDVSRTLPAFETPLNEIIPPPLTGNQAFAEFVTGWFKPKVTGNYVFFVNSDDRNDLYLSTDATPENLKLIAQETSWSLHRLYLGPSGGGSDLTAKRSDQFAGSEWPTPNTITLTAGQRYYIRGVHQSPSCCGNNFTVTFTMEGDADPENGSESTLTGDLIETLVTEVGPPIDTGLFAYEGFDYAAGEDLTGKNGGTGWTTAWGADNAGVTDPGGVVPGDTAAAASLTYTDAKGNRLLTSGGHAVYSGAAGTGLTIRDLAPRGDPGTTTWISFMGIREGPTANNADTPDNPYPRGANVAFNSVATEKFAIGLASGSPTNAWSILNAGGSQANQRVSTTPYSQLSFVVIRVDHLAGNDQTYMFLNPNLDAEPGTTAAAAMTLGEFDHSFNRVRPFYGGDDAANSRPYAQYALDEIRIGGSYAAVTPFTSGGGPTIAIRRDAAGVPEITYTGTLESAAAVNGSYQPVPGATSPYKPNVQQAATQFYRTKN